MANACRYGKEMETDLVMTLTGRRKVERTSGRSDIYICSPDGFGIFVLVPMKDKEEAMIRTYLRAGSEQSKFIRSSVLGLTKITKDVPVSELEPVSENNLIVDSLPEDVRESLALLALRGGAFVKCSKNNNRCVAFKKGQSVDTDRDAIFTLALWCQTYMDPEAEDCI
tara:strand:+ start:304 stop:807 length:504 start_codon:yes stop_codon:yes gene_type:complete